MDMLPIFGRPQGRKVKQTGEGQIQISERTYRDMSIYQPSYYKSRSPDKPQ
jgi:hypothetical protein